MGRLEPQGGYQAVLGDDVAYENDARPTWDQVWLATGSTIAQRSRCSRRQVGAVIVTPDNRVAAFSYNGPPRGMQVEGPCVNWCPRAQAATSSADYSSCPAVHAEANAIIQADHVSLQGATIYVTSAMCVNCAKIVANSGIQRVIHVVSAEDAHRHPDEVEKFLQTSGITTARVMVVDESP